MKTADRVWISLAIGVPIILRDKRHRRKIKELKKLVELLNLENEFLHTFIVGLTDPKVNKDKLVKDLSDQFQFLTLVKDV